MSAKSNTPRSDAAIVDWSKVKITTVPAVSSTNMRHLETELYAAQEREEWLRRALKDLYDRICAYSDYDEGCLYYNKMCASELEAPLEEARKALSNTSSDRIQP